MPQDEVDKKGWSVEVSDAATLIDRSDVLLADLREHRERRQYGVIAGSVHTPYSELSQNLETGGMLHELIASSQRQLLFYCAYGERSAMAVMAAQEAGIECARHVKGGMDAWKKADLPVQTVS